jgi:hypothetical protein
MLAVKTGICYNQLSMKMAECSLINGEMPSWRNYGD